MSNKEPSLALVLGTKILLLSSFRKETYIIAQLRTKQEQERHQVLHKPLLPEYPRASEFDFSPQHIQTSFFCIPSLCFQLQDLPDPCALHLMPSKAQGGLLLVLRLAASDSHIKSQPKDPKMSRSPNSWELEDPFLVTWRRRPSVRVPVKENGADTHLVIQPVKKSFTPVSCQEICITKRPDSHQSGLIRAQTEFTRGHRKVPELCELRNSCPRNSWGQACERRSTETSGKP